MRSQWEDITPARAREDLKTAKCGRVASRHVIERYSRDMASERWRPTIGLLWWLLGRADEQRRDVFIEALRTGSGLPDLAEYPDGGPLHPVLMLRKRLAEDYYASAVRGAKMKQETVLYLCLRSWEAWRKREHTRKLQMPSKLTDDHFKDPR
jgi:hypothetical protein